MAFLGNNFNWFVGVVEDRHDPEMTGRLRVRCLGVHTGDKLTLPTADLPWASVTLPTTASGISGLGQSPSFIVEGSWVWGYFRDESKQEPVILGTMPGKPAELGNTEAGFYDPNSRLDADGQPTNISVYPKEMGEPDTNRLAVNNADKEHSTFTLRKAERTTKIPTADFDEVGSNIKASDTDNWNEPEITYKAAYPYNHVFESESGHIKEYDDTELNERIHERHKSGTSYEMLPNGDLVTLVKNSHYAITSSNNKAFIQGDSDITINGRHKVYINKNGQSDNNYDIQVGPGANVNIQVDKGNLNVVTKTGQFNFDVGSDMNINVGGNYNLNVQGNILETAKKQTTNVDGEVEINAGEVDINAVPINLN